MQQKLVDEVHQIMWGFCQEHDLDIDPVQLRRGIQRQISGALSVVSPETFSRIGARRIALMIDTAGRFDVTLAEMLNESIMEGSDKSSSLCQTIKSRKNSTQRVSRKPHLSVVK